MNHDEAWKYAGPIAEQLCAKHDDAEAWRQLNQRAREDQTLERALQIIGFSKVLGQQQTRQ